MTTFQAKTFSIPELKGISKQTIEDHLGLYAGYVKHANHVLMEIERLSADSEANAYELAELQRRFGFEFGGMRNHEVYFASFVGGSAALQDMSNLAKAITESFGSVDAWLARFKAVAATRGVGWAMLCYDPESKSLVNTWVDEQHIGQLAGADIILALDMWEHSFVADYRPSGKKQYIEDFFANLNWNMIEGNYEDRKKGK